MDITEIDNLSNAISIVLLSYAFLFSMIFWSVNKVLNFLWDKVKENPND